MVKYGLNQELAEQLKLSLFKVRKWFESRFKKDKKSSKQKPIRLEKSKQKDQNLSKIKENVPCPLKNSTKPLENLSGLLGKHIFISILSGEFYYLKDDLFE